jgi:hypothetical protein
MFGAITPATKAEDKAMDLESFFIYSSRRDLLDARHSTVDCLVGDDYFVRFRHLSESDKLDKQ